MGSCLDPTFQAEIRPNCDRAAIATAEQSRAEQNDRAQSRVGPKLEYTIRAINATPEQSFPPGNSIEKQGYCVLLWQGAVLVG